VDVAEEDMKFVQFKAGPLLPIIVIAGNIIKISKLDFIESIPGKLTL
jgi:hypothetical protein